MRKRSAQKNMGINYFEEFDIEAGFTTKDEGDGPDIRDAMAKDAEKNGGLVVRAKQVHGIDVCIIDEEALQDAPYVEIDDCDGLLTNLKNVTLTMSHGDCIPVYVYDPKKHVIGLAHAGWRGTADCVVSALIYWMTEEYKCSPKDIHAVVGPGIGACCFEVDADVVDYFTDGMPWTEDYMWQRSDGKYLVDLKGINCELLEIEGVPAENISISSECTCCEKNRDRFFSYRRDKTDKRMLAYIRQ